MNRVLNALAIVFLVCLGVRVAAWIIEPVLPLLGALVLFGFIGVLLAHGWS